MLSRNALKTYGFVPDVLEKVKKTSHDIQVAFCVQKMLVFSERLLFLIKKPLRAYATEAQGLFFRKVIFFQEKKPLRAYATVAQGLFFGKVTFLVRKKPLRAYSTEAQGFSYFDT